MSSDRSRAEGRQWLFGVNLKASIIASSATGCHQDSVNQREASVYALRVKVPQSLLVIPEKLLSDAFSVISRHRLQSDSENLLDRILPQNPLVCPEICFCRRQATIIASLKESGNNVK